MRNIILLTLFLGVVAACGRSSNDSSSSTSSVASFTSADSSYDQTVQTGGNMPAGDLSCYSYDEYVPAPNSQYGGGYGQGQGFGPDAAVYDYPTDMYGNPLLPETRTHCTLPIEQQPHVVAKETSICIFNSYYQQEICELLDPSLMPAPGSYIRECSLYSDGSTECENFPHPNQI